MQDGKDKDIEISLLTRCTKRAFDWVASLLGLIVFSPVFVVVYFLIQKEDKGPILFKQERVGYKGKCFYLYKFRSMKTSSEADGKPVLCQANDQRLTKIGRFLRDHHLDELPQLYNVLKGEMSFVGYRPERMYFVEQIKAINPDYELLYKMRPGLFSKATLYNGYTDTMDKMLIRLQMDLDYLYNHSFLLDIKIIWLTATAILTGRKF